MFFFGFNCKKLVIRFEFISKQKEKHKKKKTWREQEAFF